MRSVGRVLISLILISLLWAMGPQVDKRLKSVTHGQCDARPTVTSPVAGHHRSLTGTNYYTAWWQRHMCANNLPKVVTWKQNSRRSNQRPLNRLPLSYKLHAVRRSLSNYFLSIKPLSPLQQQTTCTQCPQYVRIRHVSTVSSMYTTIRTVVVHCFIVARSFPVIVVSDRRGLVICSTARYRSMPSAANYDYQGPDLQTLL